jgi:hypothetical protein
LFQLLAFRKATCEAIVRLSRQLKDFSKTGQFVNCPISMVMGFEPQPGDALAEKEAN